MTTVANMKGDIRIMRKGPNQFEQTTFNGQTWVNPRQHALNPLKDDSRYTLLTSDKVSGYYRLLQPAPSTTPAPAARRPVRSSSPDAPVQEEKKDPLQPYTNSCAFSGKLGGVAEQKEINGYQVVIFSMAHWQPRDKPALWLTCYVYDEHLMPLVKALKKGQSVIVRGKFTYDVYEGKALLGMLVNEVEA